MMPTAGYSGTPLAKKLGIKPDFKIKIFEAPKHYFDLFADWPEGVEQVAHPDPESLDFIHVFTLNSEALEKYVPMAKPFLKKNGSLWVSWPKGSSGMQTNINRESIRDFVLKIGLVDVKVAAVDENWSGLKVMYRTKDR